MSVEKSQAIPKSFKYFNLTFGKTCKVKYQAVTSWRFPVKPHTWFVAQVSETSVSGFDGFSLAPLNAYGHRLSSCHKLMAQDVIGPFNSILLKVPGSAETGTRTISERKIILPTTCFVLTFFRNDFTLPAKWALDWGRKSTGTRYATFLKRTNWEQRVHPSLRRDTGATWPWAPWLKCCGTKKAAWCQLK